MIHVDGGPDLSHSVVEFDRVGIALVMAFNDRAGHVVTTVGLYLVADRKSKLVGVQERQEPVPEVSLVEVLPDKDKAVLAFVGWNLPLALELATKHHADALKDELVVVILDGQDTLVAVEIGTVLSDQAFDPTVEHVHVEISFDLDCHGGHND